MLKYNFCLIKRGDEILLLNREFPSWMGCWNGVGGKLEEGELPRVSVKREILEETSIDQYDLHFKGMITWEVVGVRVGGMYTYVAEVADDFSYPTPVKTAEGILDWKKVDWIAHPENLGVSSNIRECLDQLLFDEECYDHHFIYQDGKLVAHHSTVINELVEHDEEFRNEYLAKYDREARLENMFPLGG